MIDISKWPMSRIMQLPADCFGERYVITFANQLPSGALRYEVSPFAFPDRTIIWGVNASCYSTVDHVLIGPVGYSFKLAQEVVTTDDEYLRLQDVFPGSTEIVGGVRLFRAFDSLGFIKVPVLAQGRKLLLRAINFTNFTIRFNLTVVISSIPKEIPDLYAGSPTEQLDEIIRLLTIGVKFPR